MATAPVGILFKISPTVGFAPSHGACRRVQVPSSNRVSAGISSFILRPPQGTVGWQLHPWGFSLRSLPRWASPHPTVPVGEFKFPARIESQLGFPPSSFDHRKEQWDGNCTPWGFSLRSLPRWASPHPTVPVGEFKFPARIESQLGFPPSSFDHRKEQWDGNCTRGDSL